MTGHGKVALVTGAGSGIGRAVSLTLQAAGFCVVLAGRHIETLQETAAAIEAKGRRTLRLTADVTSRASLQGVNDACIEHFGKVDILIAAAGVTTKVSTLQMTD